MPTYTNISGIDRSTDHAPPHRPTPKHHDKSTQVLNEEYARVVETLLHREAQAARQQRVAAHARALVAAGT